MNKLDTLEQARKIIEKAEIAKGLDRATASAIAYATIYAHCSIFVSEYGANKILEIVSERVKKS
jgi:hypothetical protein